MLNSLVNRVKSFRKAQYFKNELFLTKKKYAFIGIGMHSLTNLYPVLRHYGIPLKYICTKNSSWENEMIKLFPGCKLTNDINDILRDQEVEGVFVSASPRQHFEIVIQLLRAGKKVFVEKPPCESSAELQQLIALGKDQICKIGLQRRYWPATRTVFKKAKNARSYTYQFHTGPYIESDVFTGLFIHPIDFIVYLFGAATVKSFNTINDDRGITVQVHLLHNNKVSGLLECSTHHSWNSPIDHLQIDTTEEYLSVQYPGSVEGQQKPSRILNVPAERLLNQATVIKQYYSTKNYILPVTETNSIFFQGFYSELEAFIKIVEGKSGNLEKNDLPGLNDVYNIFDIICKG